MRIRAVHAPCDLDSLQSADAAVLRWEDAPEDVAHAVARWSRHDRRPFVILLARELAQDAEWPLREIGVDAVWQWPLPVADAARQIRRALRSVP